MADGASPPLTPKEAIALGMKYFTDLMDGQPTVRVLLEGVELDHNSGNWVVTFGFDSKREKLKSTSIPRYSAMLAMLEEGMIPDLEIVREFRSVLLSSKTGEFVKLEHA